MNIPIRALLNLLDEASRRPKQERWLFDGQPVIRLYPPDDVKGEYFDYVDADGMQRWVYANHPKIMRVNP
jgi:hypothetical protein